MQTTTDLAAWNETLQDYRLPRWNDLPNLDLYMDQVVSLIEGALRAFSFSDQERMITPAMVNNYVKSGIVPAPVKKRYGREHVARLMMLTILKQILSISQINELLLAQQDSDGNIQAAYDVFCQTHEHTLRETISSAVVCDDMAEATLMLELAALSFASKSVTARMLSDAAARDTQRKSKKDKKD